MRKMKSRVAIGLAMAAALLLGSVGASGTAQATTASSRPDAEIVKRIVHEVRMYPYYTIWDDVTFRVTDGQVELIGAVSQPYKKTDLLRIVQKVPGVSSVSNELRVLPFSNFDDRIRLQVARAIYGDPVLTRYAMDPLPSIHILVDNGQVTLTGSVRTEMEKNVAFIRASGVGLSLGPVINNLQVEKPAPKS
jgi:hyperosmotically inducible periplasmic protein